VAESDARDSSIDGPVDSCESVALGPTCDKQRLLLLDELSDRTPLIG
jgi:hypothetical protein